MKVNNSETSILNSRYIKKSLSLGYTNKEGIELLKNGLIKNSS